MILPTIYTPLYILIEGREGYNHLNYALRWLAYQLGHHKLRLGGHKVIPHMA